MGATPSSPGPPHLQHPQHRPLLAAGLLSLQLPGVSSEQGAGEACALTGRRRDVVSGRGLASALVSGAGQRLQEVVEQAGPDGFIHPVARQQHVVHLVHALDVAGAVLLLGLQVRRGVCMGERHLCHSDPWW